nr:MAG TPA: hypothetical protein [Caudoviricetes sp.]
MLELLASKVIKLDPCPKPLYCQHELVSLLLPVNAPSMFVGADGYSVYEPVMFGNPGTFMPSISPPCILILNLRY